jgi:CheY-like chemotaxis protein
MDLLMPEMDGYEATRQIRSSGYTLPVIAMSADEDDETRAAAFKAGMNEYVRKPARVENIKQLLIKLFSTTI